MSLVFVIGLVAGLWIGRWENGVTQKVTELLGEKRFMEVIIEDSDEISHDWDSKPEVARALLERQLRAHERLLQVTKKSKIPRSLLTDDMLLKDMAFMHIRLASLCRRMNQPECVSEQVEEAIRLGNTSSNAVWAAMEKLDGMGTAQKQIRNE